MKVRLTTLNKNEYFEQAGEVWKKIDNREKSGKAENVKTKEVSSFPTMLYVTKMSKEEVEKPKRRKPVEKDVEKEIVEEVKPVVYNLNPNDKTLE